MKFKTITSLAGIFSFVFSFTLALSLSVYAGEGGGIPGWCYDGNPYDPLDPELETLDGQCCITGNIRGQWENIGSSQTFNWICNCVGIYDGPLLWNPCNCTFSCGGWPD